MAKEWENLCVTLCNSFLGIEDVKVALNPQNDDLNFLHLNFVIVYDFLSLIRTQTSDIRWRDYTFLREFLIKIYIRGKKAEKVLFEQMRESLFKFYMVLKTQIE